MIPAEAVEAAARVAYEAEWGDDWDKQLDGYKSVYLDRAQKILEAAAPYMMGQAWDEGYEKGTLSQFQEPDNPYRK